MFADNQNRITGDLVETYRQDIARGIQDQPNQVHLTFKSEGSAESPDRIIIDARDPTGAKLPVLFPHGGFTRKITSFNGVAHMGVRIPYNYVTPRGSREIGTMEAVNHNKFFITAPCPSLFSLALLRSRGIYVYSDNRPIGVTILENQQVGGGVQCVRCTYIFADRVNAVLCLTYE